MILWWRDLVNLIMIYLTKSAVKLQPFILSFCLRNRHLKVWIICCLRDLLKLMFDPAFCEIAYSLLDQVVKTEALCVVG